MWQSCSGYRYTEVVDDTISIVKLCFGEHVSDVGDLVMGTEDVIVTMEGFADCFLREVSIHGNTCLLRSWILSVVDSVLVFKLFRSVQQIPTPSNERSCATLFMRLRLSSCSAERL